MGDSTHKGKPSPPSSAAGWGYGDDPVGERGIQIKEEVLLLTVSQNAKLSNLCWMGSVSFLL